MDKKESLIPVIDETSKARDRVRMDFCQNGVESNTEFWPIEHPTEPPDEDQPVKCPVPDSSLVNEEQFCDSPRKRTELSAVVNKEGMMVVAAAAAEPPAQAVRKRHHAATHRDHTVVNPPLRRPPVHPLPTRDFTIFQLLQPFNKSES
ncbi:uncharacterized protein LOC127809822 isoform X2 [Diospyros lotus]|uniref:uncharacterized protein LOC127809822 isoform X2 n=1 Tax=Diospyros lotus TaxID=55363 RepID=UPI002258000E|nr:uncharacterized protein LOC127809822 isoform X2 [Diospyros lotus]